MTHFIILCEYHQCNRLWVQTWPWLPVPLGYPSRSKMSASHSVGAEGTKAMSGFGQHSRWSLPAPEMATMCQVHHPFSRVQWDPFCPLSLLPSPFSLLPSFLPPSLARCYAKCQGSGIIKTGSLQSNMKTIKFSMVRVKLEVDTDAQRGHPEHQGRISGEENVLFSS